MLLPIVFTVVTLAVLAALIAPLLRASAQGPDRAEFDLRVYRDQLDNLGGDLARGTISAGEEAAARLEIERRMLHAGAARETPAPAARRQVITAVLLALLVPIGAAALYFQVGRPDLPSQPLAMRNVEGQQAAQAARAGEFDQLAESLADKLAKDPADYSGWMLLGRTYLVAQRPGDAIAAYRRAAALPEAETNSSPHSALGEAMVTAAGGVVTPEAVISLKRATAIDPHNPGARYYLALADAQAGKLQAAYDGWLALVRDSEPDAPWMVPLRQRLQQIAGDLGVDLAAALPATEAPPAGARGPSTADIDAASEMGAEDRQAMIRSMVGRLAARLEEQPDDSEGWTRLGRSYGVLGEPDSARDAFARAAALKPGDLATQLDHARAVLEVEGMPEGKVPSAVADAYFRVLALDSSNSDALWFVGLADAAAGRHGPARDKWRRLLTTLDPTGEEYRLVTERIEGLDKAD